MGRPINLADPDFEPTDDELRALSTAAFAGVREAHERALATMHVDIAARRRAVLLEVAKRLPRKRVAP
jgi:hypothetical protein